MALSLTEEFERLIAALEEAGAPYAVVGALAVAIHGSARATTDIDLLVPPSAVDEVRAVARARGFTAEALPMRFRDGVELRRSTKLDGVHHLTLDLLLVDENLAPVWASRHRVETEAGPVQVVGRDALIQMKLLAGRPQDLYDVQRLQELDR